MDNLNNENNDNVNNNTLSSNDTSKIADENNNVVEINLVDSNDNDQINNHNNVFESIINDLESKVVDNNDNDNNEVVIINDLNENCNAIDLSPSKNTRYKKNKKIETDSIIISSDVKVSKNVLNLFPTVNDVSRNNLNNKRKTAPTLNEQDPEINDIENDTEKKKLSPENIRMNQFLSVLKQKQDEFNEDRGNKPLIIELRSFERKFVQQLFVLEPRVGNQITWLGWKLGVVKVIKLTMYGKAFANTKSGSKYDIIKTFNKTNNPVLVCTTCWENTEKALNSCVFISGVTYSHSNIAKHLSQIHPTIDLVSPEKNAITNKNNLLNFTKGNDLFANKNKSQIAKQSSISTYSQVRVEDSNVAMQHIYNFFNEANIAIQQTNNEHFKKFIDYIIDYGNHYKTRRSELYFSRYKYKKYENFSFSNFIYNVHNIIQFSREFYKKQFNSSKTVSFINVAHDGWDSKDNDILGVSIHLIIPFYWNAINIAVGLKRVTSKVSIDTSKDIESILKR